jgi:hypothetical protein
MQQPLKPMKRTKLGKIVLSGLTGTSLLTCVTLNAGVAVIELERSMDARTWEKVVLDPTLLTTTGGVMQNTHDPKAFYRLKINDDQKAGFVTAIPLSQVPAQALAIARQFLEDFSTEGPESEEKDPEGGWRNVEFGPICYPIYDPAVDEGRTPAYLEFKVLRAPPPAVGPSLNDPFGLSPPNTADNNYDFGYLLVSLTTNDVPVPTFSQSGVPRVEMLLRKARTSGAVKPVRYDDGLLVAEDATGAIVGSIGNVPFRVDPSILEIAGREFEGIENGQGTQDDGGPEFPARGYASYREFKADFAANPFYVELRRLKARSAAIEWDAELGNLLSVANEGLQAAPRNAAGNGWQAWQYWYAGNWNDQRRYEQFHNDPQMCPGGASGCGPTAWAMLFGWWDRKGSPRLMKSTTQPDSPVDNDDSVRDCNRYTFDQMGPFCVNGQAATVPWHMKLGRHWAGHRNADGDISWIWGLPYASFGSISMVADSIKAGRPSILGLGYYWHYPLAYGYAGRQYKIAGVVLHTERYFKCNMGWGGSSAEWHNANSTWFGTNARYW